jgi:hypothetical protein
MLPADASGRRRRSMILKYREGGYLNICMHPFVSGRALRVAMLDRLIARMKTLLGVWFPSCGGKSRSIASKNFRHRRGPAQRGNRDWSALAEIGQCRKILLRHLGRGGQNGEAAAATRAVRFPIGLPLDLQIGLLPRQKLDGVVFTRGGAERLYRKPVLSGREIVKEDSCLRDLTNRRAIRINYRIRSIYISLHRVRHLAEKPRPRHPGLERRILRLRSRLL